VSKFPKKAFTGALATAAAVVTMAAPAFAAHTVTPQTGLTAGQGVDVTVTLPGQASFWIGQCNNDQGPDFDSTFDCDLIGAYNRNLDAAGNRTLTGATAPYNAFVVRKVQLDPDADWACDTTGTTDGATVVDGAGRRVYSTCRIRVWTGDKTGAENQSFQNITFAGDSQPVVPEAPFAALLPVGAVAVLAGGYLIVRGRKPAMNV
jgi:hypothetical protein